MAPPPRRWFSTPVPRIVQVEGPTLPWERENQDPRAHRLVEVVIEEHDPASPLLQVAPGRQPAAAAVRERLLESACPLRAEQERPRPPP